MINYFLSFQEKMGKLIKYLVNNSYIENDVKYAEFVATASNHLKRTDEEEYLLKWLELMKEIFNDVNKRTKIKLN